MKYEFEYQCDKPWDEMKGSGRKRHCDSCDKKVHHISHMTKKQAVAFLDKHNWDCCVDFYATPGGEMSFREAERRRLLQADGLKQLLTAALAVVPLALGAAFIDFDAPPPAAPVSAVAAPLDLSGPTPTIAPLVDPDYQPEPSVMAPPLIEEVVVPPMLEDVEPVIEEVEDVVEVREPLITPVRPHLRGKIRRPDPVIHLWEHGDL